MAKAKHPIKGMTKFYTTDGDMVTLDPSQADSVYSGKLRPDQVQTFERLAKAAKERADASKTPADAALAEQAAQMIRYNVFHLVIKGQRYSILTDLEQDDLAPPAHGGDAA